MKIKEVKAKPGSVKITHKELNSQGELDVTIENFDIEKMSKIIKALRRLDYILIKFCGLDPQAWSKCMITSISQKTVNDIEGVQISGQIEIYCERPVKIQTPFIENNLIDPKARKDIDSVIDEIAQYARENVKYIQLNLLSGQT